MNEGWLVISYNPRHSDRAGEPGLWRCIGAAELQRWAVRRRRTRWRPRLGLDARLTVGGVTGMQIVSSAL